MGGEGEPGQREVSGSDLKDSPPGEVCWEPFKPLLGCPALRDEEFSKAAERTLLHHQDLPPLPARFAVSVHEGQ